MQRIFPIEAEAQTIDGFPVGQVFEGLEDRDEGKQHWRDTRLAVLGIEVGEVLVVELVEEHIADELVDFAIIKEICYQGGSRFRNAMRRLGFEAH